ncbi:MAG: hypothetical protein ACR2IE_16735 [Candidatus Sumerlaeaceae bacterium]
MVRGTYDLTITDLQQLLGRTDLATAQRDRARFLLALNLYQVGRESDARTGFGELQQSPPADARLASEAARYSTALTDRTSPQAVLCQHERALRWRDTGGHQDLAWKQWHSIRELANGPQFQSYLESSEVPVEDRATARLAVATLYFELSEFAKAVNNAQLAIDLIAPRTAGTEPIQPPLSEALPVGESRPVTVHFPQLPPLQGPQPSMGKLTQYCAISTQVHDSRIYASPAATSALFLIAHHAWHCGHHCHAVPLFRAFIERAPADSEWLPPAYVELGMALESAQDYLGAALLADEFIILHPDRKEARDLAAQRNRILLDQGDALSLTYKNGRGKLLARLKQTAPAQAGRSPDDTAPAQPDRIAKAGN